MSYFVTVSIQVNNANSLLQQQIKQKLQELGLYDAVKGGKGISALPPYTYAGEFKGESSSKIRDDLSERVTTALKSIGVRGTLFMAVGQNWGWAYRGL